MRIDINELEQYLKLERAYQKFALSLKYYEEDQKLQLKRLEDINITARYLHDHKDTPWWKNMPAELKEKLTRISIWGLGK